MNNYKKNKFFQKTDLKRSLKIKILYFSINTLKVSDKWQIEIEKEILGKDILKRKNNTSINVKIESKIKLTNQNKMKHFI